MRVTVDHERCVGAAQCVLAAPAVFGQGEDGLVRLLDARPAAELWDRAREAVAACPSRSITIHED
jgi:ferredoxin